MAGIDFYTFINQRLKHEGLKPLNQFQMNVLTDPHRFKSITWHRKAGKTLMSLVELLRQAQMRVGTYWIIFPYLDEGRDTVWNGLLFKIIPEELIDKKNENFMSVRLKNGSYIRLKGADHPDSLRGPNVVGVIFDEFAKQKVQAWHIVSPMITATKGWAWFVSTPIGKNHHYDYYLRGSSLNNPQWKSWYLKASESGIIEESELEREYNDLGPEMYSQEYEVAWLEGAGQVFRGVDKILNATPQGPLVDHLYVIGCDVAKLQDYTVLTVFDRRNNMQVFQDRFSRIDWPLQRQRIAEVSKLYNNAIVSLDATGVGDPLVDELGRMSIPVNPVRITEPIKREMVDKLQRWIQNKWLSILNIKETVDELGDYAYKKGPTGKYTYSAPSGRHDDCFVKGTLVLTDKGQVPIEKIKVGDMVMTRKGYRPVVMTRHKPKVVITNLGLRGTPDHPVILGTGEEKPLQKVSKNDTIHIWNQSKRKIEKLSYTKAKSIIGIQAPKDYNLKTIFGDMINGKLRQLPYIAKFGLTTLGQSLKGLLSTTKTTIHLITVFLTYNVYPNLSMFNTTFKSGLIKKQEHASTSFAVNSLHIPIPLERQNFVLPYVGEEIEMVYNLQVSDQPEYFANNILVHNCVMSLALAVLELTPISPAQKQEVEPSALQLFKNKLLSDSRGEDEYWENLREWGES